MAPSRAFRLAIVLLPLLLISATCITDVRQRGPGGPWTIDVMNNSAAPVTGFVSATIFDATGRELGYGIVRTCPGIIPPHGTGAAEVFLRRSFGAAPVHPFRATFQSANGTGPTNRQTSDGLRTRAVEWHADQRFVMVDVKNTSAIPLSDVTVCATLRGPHHELLEVGNTPLFPTTLRPGETQSVPIYFNTVTTDNIEIFASGSLDCCDTRRLDDSSFAAGTTSVANTGLGRLLRVAGELTNTNGQDLAGVRVVGYIDGAPETRIEGVVACGTGVVGRARKVPVTFKAPIPGNIARPRFVVSGIEGRVSEPLSPLPVTNVRLKALGSPDDGTFASGVQATISNPSSTQVGVRGACATLRDSAGAVVGGTSVDSQNLYQEFIREQSSVPFAQIGTSLAQPATADIVAYGVPLPPPPPPGRIGGPD